MASLRSLDVLIIGCGTAGLAAAGEVARATEDFAIVSNGVYGTTCVLAGCMPSKTMIRAAELFDERRCMESFGIKGGEKLTLDRRALLAHVRRTREHFLAFTLEATERYRPHIVEGHARFLSHTQVQVEETIYEAKRIVIATGSHPVIPPEMAGFGERLLTSDNLFEQDDLPDRLGVVNLSVLGAEMAQSFARLGIMTTAIHDGSPIGGLSDPEVSAYASARLAQDFGIRIQEAPQLLAKPDGVEIGGNPPVPVDRLFLAMSREANLTGMGLEELGLIVPGCPIMGHDRATMRIGELPIFVAGDVHLGRSILSEAADEGRIAGHNAVQGEPDSFRRRTHLLVTYTKPTIAVAGIPYSDLDPDRTEIGEARFDDQGKAKIMGLPSGILRLYADKADGALLGAELFAPMGEHLAHMIAWLIDRRVSVADALQLPFYHPSIEEGIKTALKDLHGRLRTRRPLLTP